MIPIQLQDLEDLEFQEKFNPALISALYSNFKDPIQAILEIVDNAVDDIIIGKPMVITVDIHNDKITIVDKGGSGMGSKELDAFFTWGLSEKRGKLGRYGQGGKAAMGYLGKSWQIRSTRARDEIEYTVEELNWDDREGGLKKYKPKVGKTVFVEDGIVQIDIWNLKRKVNKNELKRVLGTVYRPLLRSGKIKIYSNGEVLPEDLPLEMSEEHLELELRNGNQITGWLSLSESGSKVKGGVRCYAFGRLIVANEFFGQKDPGFKESLDRLIGELYINIEELPLLMNKSDFDRGSPIWEEVKEKIYRKMEPYIQLLLEEKEKDIPTEKEQQTANYSGDVWAQFLRYLQNTQKEGSMPGLPITYGQKPPESKTIINQNNIRQSMQQKREAYEPATPPPLEHIGKRKRTGAFPKPIIHPLPEYLRYQLAEDNGVKVIKINNKFSSYRLRRNQLPLYIWETLALEYAKAEDASTQTVNEYINEMNNLLKELGDFIRTKEIKINIP